MKARILTLAAVATTFVAVWTGIKWFSSKPESVTVFVHGLGGSGEIWFEKRYPEFLGNDRRFVYMGDLSVSTNGDIATDRHRFRKRPDASLPFYTVSLPDRGMQSIETSAKQLGEMISVAKSETGAERVNLVGYSLGGVISRCYLTSDSYSGDVNSLATISSPHLGSEFALLGRLYATHSNSTNPALAKGMQALREAALRLKIDIAKPAIPMLCPPGRDNFLARLNKKPIPDGVKLLSVVAERHLGNYRWKDLRVDIQKIEAGELSTTELAATVADLGRTLIALAGEYAGRHLDEIVGDGIVSAASQNMANLPTVSRSTTVEHYSAKVEASHKSDAEQKHIIRAFLANGHPPGN